MFVCKIPLHFARATHSAYAAGRPSAARDDRVYTRSCYRSIEISAMCAMQFGECTSFGAINCAFGLYPCTYKGFQFYLHKTTFPDKADILNFVFEL